MAHHPIGFEVTSNLPNVQSLNATYQLITDPDVDAQDTLIELILNREDLATFRTDHRDNSARFTVFPGGEDETMMSLAVPSMPYPAWPSVLLWSEVFPEIESPTARQLVFNMTKGENRVDVVMSGIDNFIYG